MRKIDKKKNMVRVNILTEHRHNEERIKEFFGSAKRNDEKVRKLDKKLIINEINDFDFTNLIYVPSKDESFTEKVNIIDQKVIKAKDSLPTLFKYIPMLFKDSGNLIAGIDVKNNNGILNCICPASWYNILSGSTKFLLTNDDIKNTVLSMVNEKINQ